MEQKILCRDCICWEYQADTKKGLCRKYAPAPTIMEANKTYSLVIPSTAEEDGCFDGTPRS